MLAELRRVTKLFATHSSSNTFLRCSCRLATSCLVIFRLCKTSMHPDSHAHTLVCPPYLLSSLSCFLRHTDCGTLKLAKFHYPHLYRCCIQGHSRKSAHSLIIFMISLPHYASFIKPTPHCQSYIDYRPSVLSQLIDADSRADSQLSVFIYRHNNSSLLSMRAQSISKMFQPSSLSNRATVCRIYWFF